MLNPDKNYPAWPEFIRDEGQLDPDNTRVKKEIAAEYGEEALRTSWIKVCKTLEAVTKGVKTKQTAVIPDIHYDQLASLSEEKKAELLSVGCFVVRGAIPEETANEWFQDLQNYVSVNKDTITGWPEEAPYILRLFWSRTQLNARTHPRQMALQHLLNLWWHDDEDEKKTFAEPLAYADAVRIRPPGKPFNGLGPHIDAGSMCRWDEPNYRKVYDKIWAGKPDEWDPYDITVRKRANPNYYPGPAQARIFRAFQGWTALTRAGAQEGSLLVYPNVKTVVAYVLLRPFFHPPAKEDEMNPEKWTFNLDDPWFPGVWRETVQEISPEPYPHLKLENSLVNIPTVTPGDTVWWHCDMVHAVEVEHKGDNISSVVYVAATPTTDMNLEYIQEQAKDFIAGVSPADHRGGCYEKALNGFPGESGILNGEDGRRAFGLTALG